MSKWPHRILMQSNIGLKSLKNANWKVRIHSNQKYVKKLMAPGKIGARSNTYILPDSLSQPSTSIVKTTYPTSHKHKAAQFRKFLPTGSILKVTPCTGSLPWQSIQCMVAVGRWWKIVSIQVPVRPLLRPRGWYTTGRPRWAVTVPSTWSGQNWHSRPWTEDPQIPLELHN